MFILSSVPCGIRVYVGVWLCLKEPLLRYSEMYCRISVEEEKEPVWPGGPGGPAGPGGPEVTEMEPEEKWDGKDIGENVRSAVRLIALSILLIIQDLTKKINDLVLNIQKMNVKHLLTRYKCMNVCIIVNCSLPLEEPWLPGAPVFP